MKKFMNYEELCSFLENDITEHDFCAVRFINVETMEMWAKMRRKLSALSSHMLSLSDFCLGDDTTPNIRKLHSRLNQEQESLLVLPLSEYLRLVPQNAVRIVQEILTKDYSMASSNKKRIYFLMYRMGQIFNSISITDPRKEKSILLLEDGERDDYSLTVVQNGLNANGKGNHVHGFRQYLRYWEQNPDKPLILHTQNAKYFEESIFFDNVCVIVNSYNMLQKYYRFPDNLKQEYGSSDFWDKLLQYVIQHQDFNQAVCAILNVNTFETNKLFSKWKEYTPFEKWILWLWAKIQPTSEYSVICAKKSDSMDAFKEKIYLEIAEQMNQNFYTERKQLLVWMNLKTPENFISKVKSLKITEAFQILTDVNETEKKLVFSFIKELPYAHRKRILPQLKYIYPALGYYLSDEANEAMTSLSSEYQRYFEEYRWMKATNQLSQEFFQKVTEIARHQGESVLSMPSRNQIVSENYQDNTAILFVDGMGIEYADILSYTLSELDSSEYTVSYYAGFANLPTTTEENKDFMSGRNVLEYVSELDELKHGTNYYPDNLIKEFELIEKLKRKVLDGFSDTIHRIIIASDHGTSRLAVLIRNTTFDRSIPSDGRKIHKYGRYCDSTDNWLNLDNVLERDGKLIFADYTRFTQKGAPIDEIHGGASLEEWLVPVAVIDKKSDSEKNQPVLSFVSKELKKDNITKSVRIIFEIAGGSFKQVSVSIHGKKIKSSKIAEFQYAVDYKPTSDEEKIKIIVYGDTHQLGTADIHIIKSGIMKNKKFDI